MKEICIFQDEKYKKLGCLYGIFFEDINHAADGGLYPELVQNRSFEYCEIDRAEYHALTAWEKSEELSWEIRTERPLHVDNPHYLSINGGRGSWFRNTGYNSGVYVEDGREYRFSLFARLWNGEERVCLKVSVENDEHAVFAEGSVSLHGTEWKRYEVTLKAAGTTTEGRLVLAPQEMLRADLDMISLFPKDTFMGRENGMRKDLAQTLADMKPGFVRFPGGCLVHDGSLNDHDRNSMYRWKRTIGKIEERPSWKNNWEYNQSLGLGFYEYFCFCEDIGAKPVPVLPGGFNPHNGTSVPLEDIHEWVQDALDLIEFANGPEDTGWGKIRADLGHPEPFGLEYIGIGNEEIGEEFFERYPYFHNAIRKKYPQIRIINTAGPFAVGEGWEEGWRSARENGSDLIDEHYYASPEWFLANMHHYDDYDADGPGVFLGEYASWGNTYYNALVEAAYMTHLERSKAVAMACYAPLLCNVDYVNWKPDLLWFNNHAVVKTPNYHVQKLFMRYQGTDAVRFEARNLDEIIQLTDWKAITGRLAVEGNGITGKFWDIRLEDYETGTARELTSFDMDMEHQMWELGSTDSGHYRLSFRMLRSSGSKGLRILFGRKNDANQFVWQFGSLENLDCNLNSVYNGRVSCISNRIFHTEEKEYLLQLEVRGREIRTFVDGQPCNHVVDHLPELEELYITASIDRNDGRTIVKVVNLTGDDKETKITLCGIQKHQVEIQTLSGYGLSDKNTFGDPEHIVPRTEWQDVRDNMLNYVFKSHSLTIFSFE